MTEKCKWTFDCVDYWFPACNVKFIETGEKLSSKKYDEDKFCRYCGNEIDEIFEEIKE